MSLSSVFAFKYAYPRDCNRVQRGACRQRSQRSDSCYRAAHLARLLGCLTVAVAVTLFSLLAFALFVALILRVAGVVRVSAILRHDAVEPDLTRQQVCPIITNGHQWMHVLTDTSGVTFRARGSDGDLSMLLKPTGSLYDVAPAGYKLFLYHKRVRLAIVELINRTNPARGNRVVDVKIQEFDFEVVTSAYFKDFWATWGCGKVRLGFEEEAAFFYHDDSNINNSYTNLVEVHSNGFFRWFVNYTHVSRDFACQI